MTSTPHASEGRPPIEPSVTTAIVARNLFGASRGAAVAPVAAAPAGPKLVLHGVLVDAEKSRAYLEDPVAKRVFVYAVGDPIAGGQLEQISDDRVVIRRPDGVIEVMLQDPAKPRAAPRQAGTPRPAPAPAPATPPPPSDKTPQ